jgi:hypothetical protein
MGARPGGAHGCEARWGAWVPAQVGRMGCDRWSTTKRVQPAGRTDHGPHPPCLLLRRGHVRRGFPRPGEEDRQDLRPEEDKTGKGVLRLPTGAPPPPRCPPPPRRAHLCAEQGCSAARPPKFRSWEMRSAAPPSRRLCSCCALGHRRACSARPPNPLSPPALPTPPGPCPHPLPSPLAMPCRPASAR